MALKRPIADWWFEDRTNPMLSVGSDEVRALIKLCIKCVKILKSHELLSVSSIILSDVWVSNDRTGKNIRRVEKEDGLFLDVNSFEVLDLENLIFQKISNEQKTKNNYVYPLFFEILGKGVIINNLGEKQEFDNVISLTARFKESLVVDISTYTTAWLPYTLSGLPQKKLFNYNSHRLNSALQEIEVTLGLEPTYDEISDFCCINRYELDNFRDIDGEIIAVDITGNFL